MKKELLEVIKGLELVITGLRVCIEQSEEAKPEVVKEAQQEQTQKVVEVITLEEVRAVLAAKSQAGKQPEVKALITKFGGNKLTDIDPQHYHKLMQEAQVL